MHVRAAIVTTALLLLGACDRGPGQAEPTVDPPPVDAATAQERIARDLFDRLNAERLERGLPPVGWDESLAALAQEWSQEMAVEDELRHRDLQPVLEERQLPGIVGVGENIFRATGPVPSGFAHVGWMRSDGHRANILQPGWDRVGIGVACRDDGAVFATQNFGRSAGAALPPLQQADEPPPEPIARPEEDGPGCPA
jgi:uncharacterized protein YkwD